MHRKYIPIYISNKMQRYRVYLYLETALHVSGGTSTYHQERIQLYLQHLVFVTLLLLPAAVAAGSSLTKCVKERQMTYWLYLLVTSMISIHVNCNSSNYVFKNPTTGFNALFNSLGNSMCSSPEVVLAFLLYESSTVHNARDQFVPCVYFSLYTLLFIHPHRQKSKRVRSVRAKFKQLYLHTHWKSDTCLYELIYWEESILPRPKIFTTPPETPCICGEYKIFKEIKLCPLLKFVDQIYSLEVSKSLHVCAKLQHNVLCTISQYVCNPSPHELWEA